MEQLERQVRNYNGIILGSMVHCSLPIAETTIVLGAKYLTMAKDLIQERYSEVVDVVYGDTDSVFLRTVRNLSVPQAIE
jgi:DNA polymerase elongation subunit (family B)